MFQKNFNFRTISIALAFFLALSASLKLHLLLTNPFADIKTGYPLPISITILFVEILVISVVFSDFPDSLKNLVLILFFLFGGIANATSFLLKPDSSCGCFGEISVNTLTVAVLDLVIVAVLLYTMAHAQDRVSLARGIDILRKGSCLGTFLGAVVTVIALFLFSSPKGVGSLYIDAVELGEVLVGEKVEFKVLIPNKTQDNLKIIGAAKSCKCVVANFGADFIPPNGDGFVDVRVDPPGIGPFYQRIVVFVGDSKKIKYRVFVDIRGDVVRLLAQP